MEKINEKDDDLMALERCPSCLRETEADTCPHCGYPEKGHNEIHQLPVGTVLRDRYQIGKVLGQGGFGITYLAWDTLNEETVAVKEFYPNSVVVRRSNISTTVRCGSREMIPHFEYSKERFLREARALVKFKDIPEVVDILDFIEDNDTAYIVMEYVRGLDLARYIQLRGGRLSADETFRILNPVMRALAQVHKSGIIHRDISPDNIILDPRGGAKLLDFGTVRTVENPDMQKGLTKSTESFLKQGFTPIEQYNSRGGLGPWTDEYALCATVWYCLTGTIPEDASIRMAEGTDPDWSRLTELPWYQQRALAKGIARRAKDRHGSIDALLEALFPETIPEFTPENGPSQEPQTLQPEPTRPPKKRKWLLIPLGAAAAAAVLMAVTLFPAPEEDVPETPPPQIMTQATEESTVPAQTQPPTHSALSTEEEDYLLAERLMADGNFRDAAVLFEELGDYKDSSEKIPQCHYLWAEALLSEGNFQAAIDKFTALGDYEDSPERIPQCHYLWAEALLSEERFQEALDKFTALGSHQDSPERVLQVHYLWAEAFLEQNGLGAAAIHFGIASGHADARERSIALWDRISWRDTFCAGFDHNVGLRNDGTVVSTSYDDSKECAVENWTDIVAVSAGYDHTVGLRSNGTVVAAGNADSGECAVGAWTGIVAVSAGYNYTVGLRLDGTVALAGIDAPEVESWTDIVAVCAGRSHIVGLKADGTAVAFDQTPEDYTDDSYTGGPCDVGNWTDIVAVSAGDGHTVGLKSDGTVVATGYNFYGQCDVKSWTDIVAIDTGDYHTLGLKADGTVVAIGQNSTGNNFKGRRCDLSIWTNVVTVSGGRGHTIGLRTDGSVLAVGYNDNGQCDMPGWAGWKDIRMPQRPTPFR